MHRCYIEEQMRCLDDLARRTQSQLAGKHLLMIGDSLTRYQYISLAYTLRHSRLPDAHMQRNLFTSPAYHAFMDYFKRVNNVLSPYEKCDCSREPMVFDRFFENHRYYDKQRNITVTYLMYRGDKDLKHTNDSNSLWAPHPQSESAPHRSTPIHHILTSDQSSAYVPHPVDYILLNVGFFGFQPDMTLGEFLTGARQLSHHVIWKTTTSRLDEYGPAGYVENPHMAKNSPASRAQMDATDNAACATVSIDCMDTSWTRHVHRKYFNDGHHFSEPIYSLLNHQLMQLISSLH